MRVFITNFIVMIIAIFLIQGCLPYPESNNRVSMGHLVDIDGNQIEELFPYNWYIKFSEDNQSVVYYDNGVYKFNFDGSVIKLSDERLKLSDISNNLEWAIKYDEDLYIFNLDGSNSINITNNTALNYSDANFSQDSNWLTYISTTNDSISAVNLVNLSNFEKTIIIEDNFTSFYQPQYNMENFVYFIEKSDESYRMLKHSLIDQTNQNIGSLEFINPEYTKYYISRDGKTLSYIDSHRDIWFYKENMESFELLTENIERKNSDCPLSISYDGTWLIFDDSYNFYKANLNNMEITQLGKGFYPIISPDSNKIFFIKNIEKD